MNSTSESITDFPLYGDLTELTGFWSDRQERIYLENFHDIVKHDYRGGYSDAFRHSYVSAQSSFYYGDVIATLLGYANEVKLSNDRDDYEMDIHNNMIGRMIVKEFGNSDSGIEAGIWKGIIEGKFFVHDMVEGGLKRSSSDDLESYDGDAFDARELDSPYKDGNFDDRGPYDV